MLTALGAIATVAAAASTAWSGGGSPLPQRDTGLPGAIRERLPGPDAVLVRAGRPLAALIVRPDEATGTIHADDAATAELVRDWIQRMSGARLPIRREAGAAMPVYVGRAAIAAGLRVDDLEGASREGVRIVIEPRRIRVSGPTGTAPLRAGALLLELLGARWYMEGDLGVHAPRQATLALPPQRVTESPGFDSRRIWGAEGWSGMTPWKAWNGAGGVDYVTRHAWREIQPRDFDEHPDWFRMDDRGRRVRGSWLNTGHPGLREAFAARLIESMSNGEHRSLSPPDGYAFDTSPESTRLDDPSQIEPSSGRVSMSNRFIDFVNDIARRVAAVHPDSVLGFYAYSDYSLPPSRIDRIEPNVCVWIAPIRFSRFHPIGSPLSSSAQRLEEVVSGWTERASCFGYRTYNYNLAEAMTPFSKVAVWSHDIPWLHERGARGISLESFPSWDLSLPTLYLSIRLAHQPTADPELLLDDFYRNFYGAAAAPMRRYWEEIDHGWSTLPTDSGSIYSLHLVWTVERLRELDRALSRAESLATDPTIAARVAMARGGYAAATDFMAIRAALIAGRAGDAESAYDRWVERASAAAESGIGHGYPVRYLRRFVGRTVEGAVAAMSPPEGGERELLAVLPDTMLLAYERDLPAGSLPPGATLYDDSQWARVKTGSATLDQQGYPDRLEPMWYRTRIALPELAAGRYHLFFAQVDGDATVWVNGEQVSGLVATESGPTVVRTFGARRPFTVEVTGALRPGSNVVAIRADHRVLTELALGGIVAPVWLLREPPR